MAATGIFSDGNPSCFPPALNPYGFAWFRRVDSENIDLNRNFLLEGMEYRGGSEGCAKFDGFLNPQRPPLRWDLFHLKALWLVARYGIRALKQAVAAGQYDFPKGLFFGGKRPSRTNELLQGHMKSSIGSATTVVHLDFHTGLGAWGTNKLLIDYPLAPLHQDWLTRWFGAGAWEEGDPQRVAFRPRGSFGHWCMAQNFAAKYLFAFVEFGTYSSIAVIAGLRAENQAYHWGKPMDSWTRKTKQRVMELFCPASAAWRRQVMEDGLGIVEKAVIGMKADAGLTDFSQCPKRPPIDSTRF